MKKINKVIAISILFFLIGLSITCVKAWVEPTDSFPDDNGIGAPITTGYLSQTRTGDFILSNATNNATLLSDTLGVVGNSIIGGNLAIGTDDLSRSLTVNGTTKVSELCLLDDCRTTWPDSLWTQNGENIYYNNDGAMANVGISEDDPRFGLEVGDFEDIWDSWDQPSAYKKGALRLNGGSILTGHRGGGLALYDAKGSWEGFYFRRLTGDSPVKNQAIDDYLTDFDNVMSIRHEGSDYTTGNVTLYNAAGPGIFLNQDDADDLYIKYHVPGVRWWTVGPKANGDFWFSNSETHSTSVPFMIKNGGNVGIGTENPSYKLQVAGTIGATSFVYTSDESLKTDIQTIGNPLDKVEKLRGVEFKWKDDPTGDVNIGLIAQEVEKILPEVVVENSSDGIKSVEYGNIVALLIEAIKQQQKQIDELTEKVNQQ